MNSDNPYSPPSSFAPKESPAIKLASKDKAKVEVIIKDAGQFWLACLLCVFCSLLGAVIIPTWYSVRLLQWHSLSRQYPALLNPNAPKGSLQGKFQNAQWKLIVAIVLGCIIFLLVAGILIINLSILSGENA